MILMTVVSNLQNSKLARDDDDDDDDDDDNDDTITVNF